MPRRPWSCCGARTSTPCCWTSTCRARTAWPWPQALRSLARPPAVVFVTAHAEHAVTAFELEAVDYLTKPVRLERLQVGPAEGGTAASRHSGGAPDAAPEVLLIQDRGRTERVPLAEVLYFKAELKYITVRTAARSHILDASLSELEERYATQFLRVHRNALVARRAIRALEKHFDPRRGRGLGRAPERHRRVARGVAAPAQCGARGGCGC